MNLYIPENNVHGANMGPFWVLWAPDGPHVGPMDIVIKDVTLCRGVRQLWSECEVHQTLLFFECSWLKKNPLYCWIMRILEWNFNISVGFCFCTTKIKHSRRSIECIFANQSNWKYLFNIQSVLGSLYFPILRHKLGESQGPIFFSSACIPLSRNFSVVVKWVVANSYAFIPRFQTIIWSLAYRFWIPLVQFP